MKYQHGDIVMVKRLRGCTNFLIESVHANFYAVLNLKGNGKTRYKITDADISNKVGEAKGHPWLAKLHIRILQKNNEWVAIATGYMAKGQTAAEAIGNLVVLYGKKIGIELIETS
jgi:recombinational DNA repair protein RecR